MFWGPTSFFSYSPGIPEEVWEDKRDTLNWSLPQTPSKGSWPGGTYGVNSLGQPRVGWLLTCPGGLPPWCLSTSRGATAHLRGHPLHVRLKTLSLHRLDYSLRSQRWAVARGALGSHCHTKCSPHKPSETQKRLKRLSAHFLLLVHSARPLTPAEQGPAKVTGQLETAVDPGGLEMVGCLSPQSTQPSPPRGSKRS